MKIKTNFKITLITLVSFFLSFDGISQQNYSFMKLMVQNQEGKMLLVKWGDEWELPGAKFNEPKSIKSFLETMAEAHGVSISQHQLFGIYTQRWRGAEYLTLMQYYKARYEGGELVIPEDCSDIGWFTREEAIQKIPYENMKFMIRWESENPGKIATAAFERFKDENRKTQYVTLEDWTAIN